MAIKQDLVPERPREYALAQCQRGQVQAQIGGGLDDHGHSRVTVLGYDLGKND
jgi:hypothetical protein